MTKARELLLMALLAAGCADAGDDTVPHRTVVVGLETAVVALAPVRDTLQAFGSVVADGEPPEVREARLQVATAEARRTLAGQQVLRLETLARGAVAPRKELEAARAEEAGAVAAAARARQASAAFGSAPEPAPLAADEGWVMARVVERDLAQVRAGAKVRFKPDALPSRTTGRVDAAPVYVDPVTHTAPVRLRVRDVHHLLRPGMAGMVVIVTGGPRRAPLVPAAAVVYDGEQALIFVAESPERFRPRPVRIGVTSAAGVEIVDGVTAGTRVVTTGAASLLSAERLSHRAPDE